MRWRVHTVAHSGSFAYAVARSYGRTFWILGWYFWVRDALHIMLVDLVLASLSFLLRDLAMIKLPDKTLDTVENWPGAGLLRLLHKVFGLFQGFRMFFIA